MKINKQNLYKLYIIKKLTMKQIGQRFNVCSMTICKLCKKYNIETRIGAPLKGSIPWNKGKKGSQVPWNKGKKGLQIGWNKGQTKYTDERILKYSLSHKGSIHSNRGVPLTKSHKKHLSLSAGGNGVPYSNTEYGAEFDSHLKEQIRLRENYKCKECGSSQLENYRQLDVHHIDYDKKHNNMSNLVALCQTCHNKTNFNRAFWKEHFQSIMQQNVLFS